MLVGSSLERDARGPWNGIYAYTGREWDPETNLYYYRARYYDPKVGRFISEDPIEFKGGVNFYAYVDNNPPGLVDAFGTHGFVWSGKCAAQKKKPTLLQRFLAWKPLAPTPEETNERWLQENSPCKDGTLFDAWFPCNVAYDIGIGRVGPNAGKLNDWQGEFTQKCAEAGGKPVFKGIPVLGSPELAWFAWCCKCDEKKEGADSER